jgi:RNA polymerase sigma-70 factor (ECF subfamily)
MNAAAAVGDTTPIDNRTLSETMRRRLFERWMLPQRDALGRQALRFTRDRESAEDLVQETLLHAYAKLDLFRPMAQHPVDARRAADDYRAAQAWLQTILRNRFFNAYRRRQSAPPSVSLDALGESALPVGTGGDPARSVLAEAERDAALRALAALPDRYRVPVMLVDIEGRQYQEAAMALGLPINTVRGRIHRGRKLLRRRLVAWRGIHPIAGTECSEG